MQQDASAGPQHDPSGPETALVELLSRLFADAEQLLLQEIALVRAGLGESLDRVLGGTLLLFTGVLTVFSGGFALLAAVVLVLGHFVPPWAACALVGGLVSGAGLALVLYGRRLVARAIVVPRRTWRSLQGLMGGLAYARNLATTLMAVSLKTRPAATAIALGADGPNSRRAQPERSACRQ